MEAKQSFFHFFADPRLDDEDDDEDDDDEGGRKEGEHEFQLSVDEDYEAGHAFRAEIIPDAILWFTGEALDDEDDDEDDVDYGDEDDDDDDEDDDDDDEDGPASTSVPAGGAGGEQPECKQS
jgi:nucleosome assembly protein 1-like 1